jgi:hypothetical protein
MRNCDGALRAYAQDAFGVLQIKVLQRPLRVPKDTRRCRSGLAYLELSSASTVFFSFSSGISTLAAARSVLASAKYLSRTTA